MKRKWNILLTVLFSAALILVPAALFLSGDNEFSESENRYLAQKPVLRTEKVLSGDFMEDTEDYIDDQFPLRDRWISLKTAVKQLSGNREINGVYLGKDGYLIEQWLPSDVDEERLKDNTENISAFAEAVGRKTSVMVVPTAGLILQDKLPWGALMFDQNAVLDSVKTDLPDGMLVDLRQPFSGEEDKQLYYKTDHHWTTYGAFSAYRAWKSQKGESVSLSDFSAETVSLDFQGSLYSKVLNRNCPVDEIQLYHRQNEGGYTVSYNFGKEEKNSVYAPENLEKKDKYQVFLNGNHPELTIRTAQKNGKNLLVFKDSYANAFVPFLLADYEAIHVIDLRYFNGDLGSYIKDNEITEFLFLYNAKNFCEEKSFDKLDSVSEETELFFSPLSKKKILSDNFCVAA